MPLLSIRDLSFSVDGVKLLDNVSFDLPSGTFALAAGSNGAGKSTLLKCIVMLYSSWSGTVCLDGEDVRNMNRETLARRVSYLPQRLDNLPDFSVRHFMEICRYAWHDSDMEPVNEAAADVGITGLLERSLHTLSGGELQKVLIASALAQRTGIMLLDEPTAALDPLMKREVCTLLKRIATERKINILMVSHDVEQACTAVDCVLPMKSGKLLPVMTPSEFSGKLVSVYS